MTDIQEQFQNAIIDNNINDVQLLLNNEKVNPNYDNHVAIRYACSNGLINIVKVLLNNSKVEAFITYNSPISLASANGHSDILKLLLKDKRFVHKSTTNNAIIYAVDNGHFDIVEILMNDDRFDPSSYNNSALLLAFKHKNKRQDIIYLLLSDHRVKHVFKNDTFKKENIELYNELVKIEKLKNNIKTF
jgi:ankyrin repeat protein